MRILAIRGENLASLAEQFEIDLTRDPLGEAGVFAIVGPTGAGKTTLLDALCVALFDRTPRLANRSPFQIGRGDDDPTALGAHDVRTLLRRGATAGWAEVDFESGDGRRYRARWSVRRARGSSDGNLQDQQLTLIGLHGSERLGGTKTETLKAIQERLGLTFDQFRRSALLAQGDFAAFLRADGKDRSELLERMTGTEIYSRLSVAAHQRAAAAEQWLRDCRGAATAIAVMPDDARAVAELALVEARAASEAVRSEVVRAEAHARWLVEAHVRHRALAEAEVEYQRACGAAEEAGPLRDELALCRRAEDLRETWTEVRRLESQRSNLVAELAAADAAVEQSTAALGEIAQSRERLTALHEPIRTCRRAARIGESPPPVLGKTSALALAEQAAIAAADAAAWLTKRSGLAPEIVRWPDLQKCHAQHAALTGGINAIDRELQRCASRRSALVADQRKLAEAREQAERQLDVANRNAEPFHADPALGLEAAGRAEDAARQRWEEVALLSATVAKAKRAAADYAELVSRQSDLERAAVQDRAQRAALLRDREVAMALRDERARTVHDLRKIAGYAHARTELTPHEPCPLCGSADHPWADRGAVDALIEEGERGLADAVVRFDATTAAVAEIDARSVQRDGECRRVAALRAEVVARTHETAQVWRDQLRSAGGVVEDPGTAAAEALVADLTAAARASLEGARRARGEAVAAAKAYAEAQAQIEVCRAGLVQCEIRLRDLDLALASVDAEIAGFSGERAAKIERQHDVGGELDAALLRWTAALPDGDRPLRRADLTMISNLVDEWQSRADQIAVADATLTAALADIDRAAAAGERSVVDATARRGELAKQAAVVNRQLADATGILDAACTESVVSDGRTMVGVRTWIDRTQLESLLGRGSSRIDELASQLDNVARAVDQARMRVAERCRLVQDHDQQRPVSERTADLGEGAGRQDRDEVLGLSALPDAIAIAEQRAAELAAECAATDQRAAAVAATLAADDDARHRRDAAFAAFAAAERAAEVDRVLGEVIGSHDGKLFRSFAQSLTLDSLLAVANAHLEELAPRYQLERVPKHDLELQVIDRDFAREVRSVQSLSGGECFLVSLALALGLSSMSAHDVRVRTLLIDEGFGTLDPATLDGALAVLDELQATGRQVGIISHVPALLDRVHAHVRVAPRGGGRSRVVVPGVAARA